jgi:ubiquinone/menaquinone biosynthesis C-methylase UbiE
MPLLHGHIHDRATMYGLARHAELYDRHAGFLARPLYRRVVADVAAAVLPAGAVVLDVGTGPGRVPQLIAAACPQVVVRGVDLSPEMIARATATAAAGPADAAERIEFQVADVAALPFEDGSVDLVVSSISRHHWDDPSAGLREIVRVLRPGGLAWIYDFRPALRHPERITAGLDADTRLESPVSGGFWFNPIGRLVLRRR